MSGIRQLSKYIPRLSINDPQLEGVRGADGVVDAPMQKHLQHIRGRWAVYQNHLLGSQLYGHVKCVRFGEPSSTFRSADELPDTHPDTASAGWAYLLVGELDLDTNTIRDFA